jgi:hypothetical protein
MRWIVRIVPESLLQVGQKVLATRVPSVHWSWQPSSRKTVDGRKDS